MGDVFVEDADSLEDQTLQEHDRIHHPKGYHQGDTCKFRDKIATETETDKADIQEIGNGEEEHKKKQLEIILSANPMRDDYHTGIRTIEDIKTFSEACEEEPPSNPDISDVIIANANKNRRILVYSSKPITNGVFITPSKRMATDYAGGGEVYSKEVSIDDVAWIKIGRAHV